MSFLRQPLRRLVPLCALILGILGNLGTSLPSQASQASQGAALPPVNFSREILPILSDNCFYCHGPDPGHRKAGLRLDEREEATRTHDGVTAILPGSSAESELFARITTTDPDDRMPPADSNKSLSSHEIDLLKRWIDEGAPWGVHWSLSKLERPPVPPVPGLKITPQNPIDRFVAHKLQSEGLEPAPEADKHTLIRRASLDLTGLPPSADDVRAFLADDSPHAYERLVDRLLASPAYGERMAWDWMEVARYADSNGYQGDNERTMWPWRDWVVRAFNSNMPYDQFTLWQLAGDLLPNATHDQVLATGFLRNHPINGEGGRIAEENRAEYVMDMTETTGTVWLGLTFNCTRCHDHKFDPITARDYYSFFAFFNQTPVDGNGGNPQTPPVIDASSPAQHERAAQARKAVADQAAALDALEVKLFPRDEGQKTGESPALAEVGKQIRDYLNRPAASRDLFQLDLIEREFRTRNPDYAKATLALSNARKELDAVNRAVVRVMVMEDMKTPRDTFLLRGGFYDKPGEKVSAATPLRLPPMAEDAPRNRLGLAQWLVSPENPLTARVTVNRFWQMFFGVGLVKTAGDFGVQGEFPSHPEMLDWLASEFVESGWDVKGLVRLIVTSHTYRQSSRLTADQRERDPANRLLSRGARFRMPSWMIRDQALAASGLLSDKLGGAPIRSYQPEGVWEEASFGAKKYHADHGEPLYRRSLYIFWRRIISPTILFDAPSRMVCTVNPTRNNTPLHALTTLNDVTYVEAARHLAQRVMRLASSAPDRADAIYRTVLGRSPRAEELTALLAGQEQARAEFSNHKQDAEALLAVGDSPRDPALDPVEHASWTAIALAVLNSDEALTKE